jgi:predicted DCC family thiol-disulfide oxidoreductase YuxK
MQLTEEYGKHGIVLFDGVCNLCNSSVQFVLKRDAADYFRFAALQSDTGQQLLQQSGLPTQHFSTFVFIKKGKYYTQSTAALKVAKRLNGLWPLLYAFIVVPPFIRNFFYRLIANNRYRWFGRQESCMIPTPELKAKFI